MPKSKSKSARGQDAKRRRSSKAIEKKAASTTSRTRPAGKPASRRHKPRSQPEALRLRAFAPGLTASDLDKSLAFYTKVLGFIVGERWTDGGTLRGVMLKAGACELGISQDDWAKGRDRKKGEGVRIWCQTIQDVDALAARIKGAGERLSEEPKNQSWGVRSLSIDDPDGYHLTIYRDL